MTFLRAIICILALIPLVAAASNSNGTTLVKLEGSKSKGYFFGYVATSLRGEDLASRLTVHLKQLCKASPDFARAKLFIYADSTSAMDAYRTKGDLPNQDDPAWRKLQEAYLGEYDPKSGMLRIRINGQERCIKIETSLCAPLLR